MAAVVGEGDGSESATRGPEGYYKTKALGKSLVLFNLYFSICEMGLNT